MTTPKREQILQLAKELYFNDMAKSGINNFNDPEPNELSESGYIQTARSMLMRDKSKAESVEWTNYNENLEDFTIDVKQLFESNALILGSRHTGKSDVAMQISDKAMQEKAIVIVFDPSTDWIARSSIPRFVKVEHAISNIPSESIIYDVSLCSPNEQQRIVENFAKKLFEHQVSSVNRKQYLVIFEESHTYFYQNVMKAKASANSVRLLSVGRNVDIACVLISQFASMLDKFAIKHSTSQAWFGYTKEPNDINYLRQILGSEVEPLKKLNDGQFLYLTRNSLNKVSITSYENRTPKTRIAITEPILTPIELIKPKQTDTNKRMLSFVSFLFWSALVLYALSQARW